MISRWLVLSVFTVSSFAMLAASHAKPRASYTAKAWHRAFTYSAAPDRGIGQDHWVYFQQTAEFSPSFSFKGQAYGYAGNSKGDLIQAPDRSDQRSQASDIWPGELYFQAVAGAALFRVGYQQISWQEGFGVSYTNFFNARDTRASIFDDSNQIFRSAPAANLIVSGEHLSFQGIFLPYSQTNIMSPFSRWGTRSMMNLFPGQTVELEKASPFQNAQEYGARVTWAGEGFDVSVFAARLRDRQPTYALSPLSTFANLKLTPTQDYMAPIGFTTTINVDDYMVRLEAMSIAERKFNRIVGMALSTVTAQETAATLGVDSPTWEHFSFSLQYSTSMISQEPAGLVRKMTEGLSFASFAYSFTQDNILRLSSVYLDADKSLFSRLSYSWPISKRAEIEVALESAMGPDTSQGAANQNLNRFFIQLSHSI